MAEKRKTPYTPLLENIDSGCWKDKTGNHFIESFEALNDTFAYFDKVEETCLKVNNAIHNSRKKKEIETKLKGLK